MTTFVALLRAVNVGGTGKLAMADLLALCRDAGFGAARTYIASGNALFTADATEAEVVEALRDRLAAFTGRPIGVLVRTAAEMAAVNAANPFPSLDPKFTLAHFLQAPPPADAAVTAKGQAEELIRLGRREIFVHYPTGSGRSKLRLPVAAQGTSRNMNTVARLAAMAADL